MGHYKSGRTLRRYFIVYILIWKIYNGEFNMSNDINEALKQLNLLEDFGDEVPNEYGFIVLDEDDILDPWANEKRLNGGLDVVDWSSIAPCNILYAETSVQHDFERTKRRPLIVAYKSGSAESPMVIGMQITKSQGGGSFRSKFRYKMEDWRDVGLRVQSYINYDHFVRNVTDDVRVTDNAAITRRDAKGLLSCIEKDYDDLVKFGYVSTFDKELLDDFISYLKEI